VAGAAEDGTPSAVEVATATDVGSVRARAVVEAEVETEEGNAEISLGDLVAAMPKKAKAAAVRKAEELAVKAVVAAKAVKVAAKAAVAEAEVAEAAAEAAEAAEGVAVAVAEAAEVPDRLQVQVEATIQAKQVELEQEAAAGRERQADEAARARSRAEELEGEVTTGSPQIVALGTQLPSLLGNRV
jgi:hypothetical protein